MKYTPLRVFGALCVLVTAEAGEVIEVPVKEGFYSGGFYYFFKGRTSNIRADNGEFAFFREPGWLTSENTSAVTTAHAVIAEVLEDSAWLCVPNERNNGQLVAVSSLNLEEGEARTVAADSRILLLNGTLTSGGAPVSGVKSFTTSSGALLATTKCYGLIFN